MSAGPTSRASLVNRSSSLGIGSGVLGQWSCVNRWIRTKLHHPRRTTSPVSRGRFGFGANVAGGAGPLESQEQHGQVFLLTPSPAVTAVGRSECADPAADVRAGRASEARPPECLRALQGVVWLRSEYRRRSGAPPRLSQEGKPELTKALRLGKPQPREFRKASTWGSPEGSLREARERRAKPPPLLLILGREELVPFPEDRVNGLGWAGIQTQAAVFEAARGIELERRGGQPRTGWTDGGTDRVMRAPVRMTN